MEVNKAIRTAYYTALNGNVTDKNNNVILIFDSFAMPNDLEYPYILLSSQTAQQLTVKRKKRYNTSIVIDIVTGSLDPLGRSEVEDIAEQVENIVIPDTFKDLDLSGNGYQLGNTYKESDTYLTSKNNTSYIVRKILTYNHLTIKL